LRRSIPLVFLASIVTLLVGARPEAAGPAKVSFWNYITFDQPTKEFESLVKSFNGSQSKYVIESSFVGGYQDLNTKIVAALRAKNAPNWSPGINSWPSIRCSS
jgi:ABC-type glycerol-3-phosphate transport system substrate-binding protein